MREVLPPRAALRIVCKGTPGTSQLNGCQSTGEAATVGLPTVDGGKGISNCNSGWFIDCVWGGSIREEFKGGEVFSLIETAAKSTCQGRFSENCGEECKRWIVTFIQLMGGGLLSPTIGLSYQRNRNKTVTCRQPYTATAQVWRQMDMCVGRWDPISTGTLECWSN